MTWSELRTALERQPCPDDALQRALVAIDQLPSRFRGEIGSNHPLHRWVDSNFAPWARLHLVWLADALRRIDAAPGSGGLLRKLRDPNHYEPTLCELRLAERLDACGIRPKFVPEVPGVRTPDIHVEYADAGPLGVYFETTRLPQPMDREHAGRTSIAINQYLRGVIGSDLVCGGRCHAAFALPKDFSLDSDRPEVSRLRELFGQVEDACREVRATGELKVVTTERVEVAIAPQEMHLLLQKWLTQRGWIQSGYVVSGPGTTISLLDIQRGRLTGDKAGQIPDGVPSVVTFDGSFHDAIAIEYVRHFAAHAAEYFCDAPAVGAVLLLRDGLATESPTWEQWEGGFFVSTYSHDYDVRRDALLVLNPRAAVPLPASLTDALAQGMSR